jgi:hypothetical protein
MRKSLFALVLVFLCVGALACTGIERQDVLNDIGTQIGADPGADGVYQIGEVIPEVASDVGAKAGNPIELLFYGAGLGAAALLGWIKRKFILKKYQEVKAKIVKPPET